MSFVIGADRVAFLKKRHAAMSAHHCYRGMEYSEDHKQIGEWAPLIMEGRDPNQAVAATRMVTGADVNYGALTANLMNYLKRQDGFKVHFSHDVTGLQRRPTGDGWQLDVRNETTGETRRIGARYVFLGAGGAALTLLQKSGIPKPTGFAGFPVSGIWLRCGKPEMPTPRRQGLRHGGRRLAADVGAPSRHPHHRGQALGAVRALCRLLDQVPEARLVLDLPCRSARQPPAAARRGRTTSRSRNTWSGQVFQSSGHRYKALRDSIPT
jgi:Predicted dehydrogenase